MSDQGTTQTIRIVIDARPAKDGGDDAKRALQGIERQTERTGSALDRMEGKLASLARGLKGMAFAAAIAWGTQFAGQALAAAAGLDEMSEQMGITTKGLQALQFSAVQNGVKLEQLETGIAKFSQKIGEAAGGNKELIDSLNGLGVKILDTNGKLLPTEKQLQNIATAILAIDDPAKRSAASVEWFGKAGAKFQTVLKDMSGGLDDLAERTRRAGAMISKDAVEKLDKLSDAAERGQLKMRALFAENAADPLTQALDFITRKMENLATIVRGVSLDFSSLLKIAAGIASPGQIIGQLLAKSPAEKLVSDLADARKRSAEAWGDLGSPATTDREKAAAMSAYAKAQERIATLERQQSVMSVGGATGGGLPSDPDNIGILVPLKPRPGLNPAVKGAGDDVRKKIDKLLGDGQMAVDFGGQIAAASLQGARAVEELEARYKATKAAQDAYGDSAKANAPAVQALADKLYELGKAADKAKNLTEFRLGTEGIRNETQLLEAEVRLANELPEIRARELAIIKATQEAKKRGIEDSREDLDARIAAVTQQDLLKQKIEETKKVSDLWLEPVKGALMSIQSTAADAWQGILESGTISFQSLGDVFKKTIIRMAAEFLALATVRPVMSVLVQGATGMGFLSGGQAASMGYGGGAGSGFSMPGMGSMGGMGFMSQPISASTMGIDAEIANWSTYGTSAQNSLGSAFGNMTWGQGLAGVASIGMGAYQMATSRSTAGKIGGGLGMLGGGIGMASAAGLLPMLGSAGGPIGMGLGIAGMLLPALFGGGESAPLPPLSGANTRFDPGAGGYVQSGSQQNGGGSINGQFSGIGATLDAFFGRAGGLTNPGNAFGAAVWNNQREGTTSTYLLSPSQGSNQQTYNESGDPAAAIDRLIAKAFYNSIQNNSAMNASPTLRTAFTNREPTSTAQISGLFDLIDAYDQLGKNENITEAERALKEIDASFASLSAGAREWGLSMAPITAEISKQRKAYAEDFLHTIDSVLDPVGTALDDFAKEREAGMKEWAYINDNVKEVVISQAKVEEYYAKRAAELDKQLNADKLASIGQLEEAIKRLMPGGAGANLDPSGTLAGMKASYRATYGQAAAGDAEAIARLASEGTNLADYSKSYFAGSPEYNALRDEILANFQTIQAAIQSPTGSSTPLNTNDPGLQNLLQQLATSTQLNTTQSQQIAQLMNELTRTNSLLSRYLTNGVTR